MKLLVIGAGMMGSAAAYDMARSDGVSSVTLADSDYKRAKEAAKRLNLQRKTNHNWRNDTEQCQRDQLFLRSGG